MEIQWSNDSCCLKRSIFAEQNTTLEYEVVQCGAAGHTIRGAMSSSAAPLGMVTAGKILQISRTVSFTFTSK